MNRQPINLINERAEMAISKKGKRKITVNSKRFLWWVFNEYGQTEFEGNQIKIIDENQTIYLKYGLEQENEKRYLVLSLDQNHYKVHVFCPKFEDENGIIKPSDINRLINWAKLSPNDDNIRELKHGYSPQKGILKGQDRTDALRKIIGVLNER